MKPTPEELAAYADGELTGERADEMAVMVDADPDLAAEVARHRALRNKLAAHYAPILDQAVPESLSARLRPADDGVIDFASAQQQRKVSRTMPRWRWIAAPAMAAAVALAVFVTGPDQSSAGYADTQLASLLDNSLIAEQGDAGTRVLLSFQDDAGRYCRAFSGQDTGGIACRDASGWKLEASGMAEPDGTGPDQATQYRQAGSGDAALMAQAQEMARGPALDAEAERAARERGWLAE